MKRKRLKPRNPLVAASLFRKAGAHGKPNKAIRRKGKIDRQSEIECWSHNPVKDERQTAGDWRSPIGCARMVP